eukprot:1041765-Pyramimonas_sp.AAC.1
MHSTALLDSEDGQWPSLNSCDPRTPWRAGLPSCLGIPGCPPPSTPWSPAWQPSRSAPRWEPSPPWP